MADFQSWMETQADKQNAFNKQMTEQTNAFNAAEAQKDRDWQEKMSNTALTRKMADAEHAGLNPIFAVNAQGASTPSGSKATGDSPKEATDIINAMTQYTNTQNQIQAQREIAEKQIAAELQRAQIAANAQIAAANAAAAATRYAAAMSASASRYGADQSYAASKYRADKDYDIASGNWTNNIITKGADPTGILYNNGYVNDTINSAINSVFDPSPIVQMIKRSSYNKKGTVWLW